jgi:hypothetical protein
MPKRMTVFVPAILVFLPAAVLLTARTSFAQHATDDCITMPSSAPPQGRHWYFRVDRMVHRQCWYLGPGGAKVRAGARQAESPMRLPPPRPISPPTAESLAGATPARAAPGQITAGKNDAGANFIMRWPGLSLGTMTSKPAPMRNSAAMSNSYADEHTTTNAQDDMPLIWPVLTPYRPQGSRPATCVRGRARRHACDSRWRVCVCCRDGSFDFQTVHWPRPVGRSSLLDQRRSAADAHRPRERMLPAFADRPAAASLADLIRNSNGATHRNGIACPPPRPRDSDHAIEESVTRRQVARMS